MNLEGAMKVVLAAIEDAASTTQEDYVLVDGEPADD